MTLQIVYGASEALVETAELTQSLVSPEVTGNTRY